MPITKLDVPLGRLVMTEGVSEHVENGLQIMPIVKRYGTKDWGDTCPEDAKLNEHALKVGNRIVAKYVETYNKFSTQEQVTVELLVITEADRSATTILLPSEY